MNITSYRVEQVKDPFQIISGNRFEFIIDIEVPEDDELHTDKGVYVRVVYRVDGDVSGIVTHDVRERSTERILDFDLEDDEEAVIAEFCKEHLPE
ncbi:DUF6509 family protein [Paenibacillus sp. CC-CFT747]|nr:DUF6509 family protein [Paenibacillus sp. CC-CFT747]